MAMKLDFLIKCTCIVVCFTKEPIECVLNDTQVPFYLEGAMKAHKFLSLAVSLS